MSFMVLPIFCVSWKTEDRLTLRVAFMSQAVADLPNVPYGVWAKNNFNSDKLFFDGYNLYYPPAIY